MDAEDLEEAKTLKAEIRILKKALDIVGTFKESLEGLDARYKVEKAQAATAFNSIPGIIKFKEGVLGVVKERLTSEDRAAATNRRHDPKERRA